MPVVFNIKIAICQIFATATLSCQFTSGHLPCVYAYPPVLFMMCTRVWGLAVVVLSYASEAPTKWNSIID